MHESQTLVFVGRARLFSNIATKNPGPPADAVLPRPRPHRQASSRRICTASSPGRLRTSPRSPSASFEATCSRLGATNGAPNDQALDTRTHRRLGSNPPRVFSLRSRSGAALPRTPRLTLIPFDPPIRYILVYPQGCDVHNHLSLFLCVADYDKLLPGASSDPHPALRRNLHPPIQSSPGAARAPPAPSR